MARPFCNVNFPGYFLNEYPAMELLVREGEFEHDVAQVTLSVDNVVLPKYPPGTPIRLDWGWTDQHPATFVGYVDHAKLNVSDSEMPTVTLNCLSASKSLEGTSEFVFSNANIPAIVNAIASQHGFAAFVSPEVQRVFALLPQLNRSNWDFLVWVVQQFGFSLTAEGTNLYIQPRRLNISNSVPTFDLVRGFDQQEGAIYNFTQRDGVAPFNSHDILKAFGITDDGSIINLIERGDPADLIPRVIKANVERVVTDFVHGYEQLSAQLGLDTFHVDAHAEISGDPRVRPAGTIRLVDVNKATSDGFWWVNNVDHHLTPTDYRMTCSLGRDSVPHDTSSPVLLSWSGRVLASPSDPATPITFTPIPLPVYIPPYSGGESVVPITSDPYTGPVYYPHPTPLPPSVPTVGTPAAPGDFTGTLYPNVAPGAPLGMSPARVLARRQRPVPQRVRGAAPTDNCCVPDLTPRYNAWQSARPAPMKVRS